ncbi:MAG: hypothetical protein ACKVZJ_13925 [Phycisphaerales bacterium]
MGIPAMQPGDWARALRAACTPVLDAIDWSRPFTDDSGNTREIDGQLIAWHRGVRPAPPPPPPPDASADVALWHALACGADAARVDEVLARGREGTRTAWGGDAGALLPQVGTAIEVWTETELAALHALWWLARHHDRDDWRGLIDGAVTWHLENSQPDNATAHPWALHLFALRGVGRGLGRGEAGPDGDPGARLYAETMLHNCQVSLGRPDRLSALILADAARAMEVER